MRTEVLDMMVDWLRGPRGIAWQLQSLRYAPGDVPPPPPDVIVGAHRAPSLNRDAPEWPSGECVVVLEIEDGIQRGEDGTGAGGRAAANRATCQLRIMATLSGGDDEQRQVRMDYLLRAISRAVRHLVHPEPGFNTRPFQIRGDVQLITVTREDGHRLYRTDGSAEIGGAWTGTLLLQDNAPYAPTQATGAAG